MDGRTLGQKLADIITEFSGSWSYVIIFSLVCITWILLNLLGIWTFDKTPFLLFNTILGLLAAIQGPLILLSQNRQNDNEKDNIKDIIDRLAKIQKNIDDIKKRIID